MVLRGLSLAVCDKTVASPNLSRASVFPILQRLLILAFTPCDDCFSLKSVAEGFLPGWCTRGRGGWLKVLIRFRHSQPGW